MEQATLEIDAPSSPPVDRVGFELGWDHARHGLAPPMALLQGAAAVHQGWTAGQAVFRGRPAAATAPVRRWLALRVRAWTEGVELAREQVTPQWLAHIDSTHCPVTRRPLGGAVAGADAPVVQRLRNDQGYRPGHLVVLSQVAAQALARGNPAADWRRANGLGADDAAPWYGLVAEAWCRLYVLQSLATPMPQAEALRLPLAVLPPVGLCLANPVHRLQLWLTLQCAEPGWSARLRPVAQALGDAALRHDFNLWLGALAPRVLAGSRLEGALTRRHALEDAWCDPLVLRRWQHLAMQLGEAGCRRLLDTAVAGARPPPTRDQVRA
jgi:hypothetical protein